MEVTTVRAPGLGCPALWWGGARLGQWCSTEEGSDTGVGASDRREPWEHGGHPAPPMGPGPSSLPPGPRCCPGRGTVRGGEGCSGSRAAEALEAWGSEGGAQVPSSYKLPGLPTEIYSTHNVSSTRSGNLCSMGAILPLSCHMALGSIQSISSGWRRTELGTNAASPTCCVISVKLFKPLESKFPQQSNHIWG